MNAPRANGRLLLAGMAGAAIACAVAPVKPDRTPEQVPIDLYLKRGARTMWIAAHPDDELFAGPLLARSSFTYKNPVFLLVLNHGEGGECGIKTGCHPDLKTVRAQELKKVAAFYWAALQHEQFYNAPLPVSSFPKRHEIYARWRRQGDPVKVVARAIRRFRPDLLLTFAPEWGATGHPEHQLASRVANAGVRMAADGRVRLDGHAPHRVGRMYYLLNRFWPLQLIGRADPGPVTEEWDTTVKCTPNGTCLELMLRAILFHESQVRDMDKVRRFSWGFKTLSLRQVDPFKEPVDPAAVAK